MQVPNGLWTLLTRCPYLPFHQGRPHYSKSNTVTLTEQVKNMQNKNLYDEKQNT